MLPIFVSQFFYSLLMCTFLVLNLLRNIMIRKSSSLNKKKIIRMKISLQNHHQVKSYILSYTTQSKLQPSQYFLKIPITRTLDGKNLHPVMDPEQNSWNALKTGPIPKMTFLLETFLFPSILFT